MDDSKIIELFYTREEQAIVELSKKYGAVCSKVASNILGNSLDAEECVNDAYLGGMEYHTAPTSGSVADLYLSDCPQPFHYEIPF